MPDNTRTRLAEVVVAGRRLGRHINHDPRSLAYRISADGTVATARWARRTPVLDQGDLGSCTGNAAVGALGTDPFYNTVRDAASLDETQAVKVYSDATHLDPYPGEYPPDDTGSDGLSVAKVCKNDGLISGYLHITSVAAAQTAIQTGPFIVGTDWFSGMDNPSSSGVVTATGTVRGGHEYECVGYDAALDMWEFVNSWGTGYGVNGRFFYSSGTFAQLLSRGGDATVFVPLTAPAPTPIRDPADAALVKGVDPWANARSIWSRVTKAGRARAAYETWKTAKGY